MTSAGVWTYTLDAANTAVDALNDSETLSESFTVETEDLTPATVTVTINGANDAAVISGVASGSVTEDTEASVATGDLNHTDVDANNDNDVWVEQVNFAGDYGEFDISTNGQWMYVLDNANTALDALNDGQTLTDSFTVQTEDLTSTTVTITINGVTDLIAIADSGFIETINVLIVGTDVNRSIETQD
jgi:VCBS repeat-containing protein